MEVLVHISASTSTKHDERYRRQANNYHDFAVSERKQSEEARNGSVVAQNQDLELKSSGLEAITNHAEIAAKDLATFIDDTQLARSRLESQLLTSSLRAALLESQTPIYNAFVHDLGLEHPDAALPVADFIEETEADLEATELSAFIPLQQDRRDDQTEDGYDSSDMVNTQANDPPTERPDNAKAQSGSSSWSDDRLPVELPSTFSISDETSKESAEAPGNGLRPSESTHSSGHARDVTNPTIGEDQNEVHRQQSALIRNHAQEQHAIPPLPYGQDDSAATTGNRKRPNQEDARLDRSPKRVQRPALESTTSDRQRRPIATGKAEVTAFGLPTLASNTNNNVPSPSLVIRPTPPATGTSFAPSTFVTPALQTLINMRDLRERYRPLSVSRPLRPQERGYWSFEPKAPHWTVGNELEMWAFLTRTITGGNAGWGVWVVRTPPPAEESAVLANARVEQVAVEERLGSVRVFCWGEMVKHVWLLLYVASKNKIKKAGAVWCDAAGEIVVRT